MRAFMLLDLYQHEAYIKQHELHLQEQLHTEHCRR